MIQPALFLSHGAPSLVLDPSPARAFLAQLGPALNRPSAIVVISAHHQADPVAVTAGSHPETIHDFGGFPAALHAMQYRSPGDPALAQAIVAQLAEAGFAARLQPGRGLDHGAWIPLALMVPAADIPVVQVSINPARDAAWHLRLGGALAPLRARNVLIIGSGGITHNLGAFFSGRFAVDAPRHERAGRFADWLAAAVANGDTQALVDALSVGPDGPWNHPEPDHFLPFLVALGAGGLMAPGRRIHSSTTHAVLAMDAYAFGSLDGLDLPVVTEADHG